MTDQFRISARQGGQDFGFRISRHGVPRLAATRSSPAVARGARHAARPGWTLLECVLVAGIMAVLLAAIVPLLHATVASYNAADARTGLVQEGRFGLAHAATVLRQARAVTACTDDGNGAARLEFLAGDGAAMVLERAAGSSELRYGPAASPALLSRHCPALALRCYKADGTALASPLTAPGSAASVEAAMTVSDPDGRGQPLVFTTRVTLARTPPTILINEIMYDPPASYGSNARHQWVELHNPTDAPVDVAGWLLWTVGQTKPDVLLADTDHGGTSVIPAGGYGIVTDKDSALFVKCLANGSFENNFGGWSSDTSAKTVTTGDAIDGSKKAELYPSAWGRIWRNCLTDPLGSVAFSFWERRAPGTPGGRIIAQVRNNLTGVTLTAYDGPASDGWTMHVLDASSFLDVSVTVTLMFCPYDSGGRVWFDAVWVTQSPFPPGAAKIQVNDNNIGKNLEHYTVYLAQGVLLHDAVVWQPAWGGDDDGSTLSRTSPFAPSTEQASWTPGPYGGTPGAANP